MAQMDPARTQSATVPSTFQEYPPSSSAAAFRANGFATGDHGSPSVASPGLIASSLLCALASAADRTSASIAQGTKQSHAEIRAQLNEVIRWLGANIQHQSATAGPCPPVIAREYVSTLRVNFLAELDTTSGLDAHEVVRALRKLDAAEDAWKRTDRGKFISRLTGSDCADAVVAIAHDIRSPLCSILLLVDSLRRAEKGQANPIGERQLGLIYSAAFGLSTTVSNLIAAARGEDLVQGKPLPFSVSEMMHTVSAIVLPMCEEKGIPLAMRFPDHDARIGHASAIQQALLNLASNGLRYTDAGSVAMGCTEVEAERVEFWVEDTGPGIPDEVLKRLCYGFPPEGVKLRFSSAGLGLAIVRTLVEAMGSTLQVDTGSEGTRFSFLLELPHAR
jgi:signal transduction histidine kinase